MDGERTDPKQALERLVRIFETGDLAEIERLVSSGFVDHQGLTGVDVTGRDGFERAVIAGRNAWSSLEVTIHDPIVEGDRVAARLRWRGTNPDGVQVDHETIDIVRFSDDLAAEHWGARRWTTD